MYVHCYLGYGTYDLDQIFYLKKNFLYTFVYIGLFPEKNSILHKNKAWSISTFIKRACFIYIIYLHLHAGFPWSRKRGSKKW